MSQEITIEQARAAYETLKAFGMQSFQPQFVSELHEGQFIGSAIAKVTVWDFDTCLQAAGELCEEVNMHAEALMVREGYEAYRAKYPAGHGDDGETIIMVPAEGQAAEGGAR